MVTTIVRPRVSRQAIQTDEVLNQVALIKCGMHPSVLVVLHVMSPYQDTPGHMNTEQ